MEVLAGIFGYLSLAWFICGLGLLVLGQQLGTWEKLRNSNKAWLQKIAELGFNLVMPAGILSVVVLTPLILLLGLVTFIVMLF